MDKITKSIQNLFKNWQAHPKESRLKVAEIIKEFIVKKEICAYKNYNP